MPKLARFSTPAEAARREPGRLEPARAPRCCAPYLDGSLPQFYDPTQKNTPAAAPTPMVSWVAFPATLRAQVPSQRERWKLADGDRGFQDEYCEWAVTRNCRAQDHARHVHDRAAGVLRAPVRDRARRGCCGSTASSSTRASSSRDLRNADGSYRRDNRWNTSGQPAGAPEQRRRTTSAPRSTWSRGRRSSGSTTTASPVTNQQAARASAPASASRCATATRRSPRRSTSPPDEGAEIAFADPPGLHLGRPLTAGMVTPGRRGRRALLEDRARRRGAHAARALRGAQASAATSSATSRSAGARSSSAGRSRTACRSGSRSWSSRATTRRCRSAAGPERRRISASNRPRARERPRPRRHGVEAAGEQRDQARRRWVAGRGAAGPPKLTSPSQPGRCSTCWSVCRSDWKLTKLSPSSGPSGPIAVDEVVALAEDPQRRGRVGRAAVLVRAVDVGGLEQRDRRSGRVEAIGASAGDRASAPAGVAPHRHERACPSACRGRRRAPGRRGRARARRAGRRAAAGTPCRSRRPSSAGRRGAAIAASRSRDGMLPTPSWNSSQPRPSGRPKPSNDADRRERQALVLDQLPDLDGGAVDGRRGRAGQLQRDVGLARPASQRLGERDRRERRTGTRGTRAARAS